MYGILLPIFVLVRSERAETMGMRKIAKILSRVMIVPMTPFERM
jgi:hypothetical protein